MFLKRIRIPQNGKRHTYWALVKSVRTARGPRHQIVAYLGELRRSQQVDWAHVARIVDHRPGPRLPLFDPPGSPEPVPDKSEVRVRRARVERTRDFGSVYLGLTLWRALKLDIQLTQAESAFRTQKTELNLRPIWHHLEDRVQTHILFSFLA